MDITCIVSALLFFTGNLLRLIFFGKERRRDFSWEEFTELDVGTIKKEWKFRIGNKNHLLASSIINSIAWFVLCFPLLQLAYALSQQRGVGASRSVWLHVGIVVLTLGGAFTEWIGNFLYIGSTIACEVMVNDFDLDRWLPATGGSQGNDYLGWKALEVAYFGIRGMQFWVDAFEWMALFLIMVFVFVSVRRYRVLDPAAFGSVWNYLGLLVGVVALGDFVSEVLRITNFGLFSQISFGIGVANRLVLLPAWLIMLSFRLPTAFAGFDSEQKQNVNIPSDLDFAEINEEINDVKI